MNDFLKHLSLADILLKHPDAKVAIVHDDHWGILIGQVRHFLEFVISDKSKDLVE